MSPRAPGAAPSRPPAEAAAFLDWALAQPEGPRRELHRGQARPLGTASPQAARALADATLAFRAALRVSGVAGRIYPDGVHVVCGPDTALLPDLAIGWGGTTADRHVTADVAVIVIEAIYAARTPVSDSLRALDYFRAPGVAHYLLLDCAGRRVIRHSRSGHGELTLQAQTGGAVKLDPPGLKIAVDDLFVTG